MDRQIPAHLDLDELLIAVTEAHLVRSRFFSIEKVCTFLFGDINAYVRLSRINACFNALLREPVYHVHNVHCHEITHADKHNKSVVRSKKRTCPGAHSCRS